MALLCLVLAALILTFATASLARQFTLVDVPTPRKRHVGTVPLSGGVAIFLTVLVAYAIVGISPLSHGFMLVAGAVLVTGIVDDIRPIPPATRLILHYAAGAVLALSGTVTIANVGNLLGSGPIPLLVMTVPLTALAVAGLCNAYNMIDGIDGLAAAAALLPLTILYILARHAGDPAAASLLPWLCALAVFLLFNLRLKRHLPQIFLGDNGSLLIGFAVTAYLIYYSQGDHALIKPVTALWLVTIPLMDMLSTIIHRYRNGMPLMRSDRSHLHHILTDMGLSARQVLVALLGWGVICAFTGLALEALPAYLSLFCYLLTFGLHCLFVYRATLFAGEQVYIGDDPVTSEELGGEA